MNKCIVVLPYWDLYEISDLFNYEFCNENLIIHISEFFYNAFKKYGTITNFLININRKNIIYMDVYYIIEYDSVLTVEYIMRKSESVDFIINFLTFDIAANVMRYDIDLENDFTIKYWGNGCF